MGDGPRNGLRLFNEGEDAMPGPDSLPEIPDLTGKPLEIETARDGDGVVISLSGELDLATADDLGRLIRDVEESDISRIVIDLSELSFVDSSGLQALLHARSRGDGRISFLPSKHEAVTRVLALTQTDELLDT
jgi:anti-anti-sigma factor